MKFDDLQYIRQLDAQNMLGEIENLPDQLQAAWDLGQQLRAEGFASSAFSHVLVAGMGGSAIASDLLAAYLSPICGIPVNVLRDYELPAYAAGQNSLFIASSHSGNTEETLAAFEAALERGCTTVAICTGGQLEEKARAANIPVWKFTHTGQPRAAVGYSFGLLLAVFVRLGLIPDQSEAVAGAVAAMKAQQTMLGLDVPVVHNPAKRAAGQYLGRWVTVMGSGLLSPVARRIKGQINEIAKAGSNFEVIPEANHNTLAGLPNPEDTMTGRVVTLFLQSTGDHPRNQLRTKITRQAYMLEGMNTDLYTAAGDSPLANMWTALHYGDYVAFYLAVAYGVDPTPVTALQHLKSALKLQQ